MLAAAKSEAEDLDGSEPELMEAEETVEEPPGVTAQQAQDKLRLALESVMANIPAKGSEYVRERTPRRKDKAEDKADKSAHPN